MTKLDLIRELRAIGQHEAAREQLVILAAQFPNDPDVQYEAASVHDFLGREREAVPFYRVAMANGLAGDELRGAYLGLGSTYRTLGMYPESEQVFTEGLRRFPEANELKVFRAMTQYNLGEHHKAMSALLTVLAETTSDPDVKQYSRAIALYASDLNRTWE